MSIWSGYCELTEDCYLKKTYLFNTILLTFKCKHIYLMTSLSQLSEQHSAQSKMWFIITRKHSQYIGCPDRWPTARHRQQETQPQYGCHKSAYLLWGRGCVYFLMQDGLTIRLCRPTSKIEYVEQIHKQSNYHKSLPYQELEFGNQYGALMLQSYR